MKALEDIKPNIQRCYDTLLQDFPDAAGMVRIRLIVKTENTMARVQLSEVAEPTTLLDSHAPQSEASASAERGCRISPGRQPTGVTFHTTKPLTPNAHANSPTNPTAHTQRPLKHLRQVSFSLSTPAQNAPETQTVIVHCRAKCTTNCSLHGSPQSFVERLDF